MSSETMSANLYVYYQIYVLYFSIKGHKYIPDATKTTMSRASLQLLTFVLAYLLEIFLFDWSQQDFLLCVNWITVHATNIYTANDPDLPFAFFTHHKALVVSRTVHETRPGRFTAPRCENTIEALMLDKRTVSCRKLSRQNTRMESEQIQAQQTAGSSDNAENGLFLLVLWSLSCAGRPTFTHCRLCARFRCHLNLPLLLEI